MTDRESDPVGQGYITSLFPKKILFRVQNGKILKWVTVTTVGRACGSLRCLSARRLANLPCVKRRLAWVWPPALHKPRTGGLTWTSNIQEAEKEGSEVSTTIPGYLASSKPACAYETLPSKTNNL